MMRHDVAIVGGGCVGLSVAKHLTERTDLDVAVLEKEHHLASHQSGRNSGVLHPGFNYPPDSKKARFATEGTARMKAYCEEHDVPCEELGVLVVATDDEEEARLDDLAEQAEANGVAYELLDSRKAIRQHEPHAEGRPPSTLRRPPPSTPSNTSTRSREVREAGVTVYTGYEVSQIEAAAEGYRLDTSNGRFEVSYLVNAAGLHADTLAHQVGVGEEYQVVPFRGVLRGAPRARRTL